MVVVTTTTASWGKRGDMIVRGHLPYNAEPPPPVLASSEITPIDAFYARNHGPFPDIAPRRWRLAIDGRVDRPLTVTYEQLTTDFDQHRVVATLACAGNRRAELPRLRPIPGTDPWAHCAISSAAATALRALSNKKFLRPRSASHLASWASSMARRRKASAQRL